MTRGQLFRQVVSEVEGKPVSEAEAKYADSWFPDMMDVEIPDELAEKMKPFLMKAVRELVNMTPEERHEKCLKRFIDRN